jgi:hypothetical protein
VTGAVAGENDTILQRGKKPGGYGPICICVRADPSQLAFGRMLFPCTLAPWSC